MTKPRACPVPPEAVAVLPEADFADAYEVEVAGQRPALEWAQLVFLGGPSWVKPLLGLRNVLTRPFGLKGAVPPTDAAVSAIGFFPVVSTGPNRVVLGLDDKHLDFRIVVDAAPLGNGNTRITVSTVIKRHNSLGRAYLAAVMPFHRIIVPAFLKGAPVIAA